MKLTFTFFLIFILTCQNTFGQVIETPTDVPPKEQNKFVSQTQYDFYSLKQKRQKTAAWICLGGGVAMTLTGLVIKGGHKGAEITGDLLTLGLVDIVGPEPPIANLLVYFGGASSAASIPLFISAGKNKRKASLSIKGEPLSFGKLNNRKSQLLSVAVTIDL